MEGQNTIHTGKVIFGCRMKAVLYLLSVVVIAAAVTDGFNFTKQCGRSRYSMEIVYKASIVD